MKKQEILQHKQLKPEECFANTLCGFSLKNTSQARRGGPRGMMSKINAGEKQMNCSAFAAKHLIAGIGKNESFIIAN